MNEHTHENLINDDVLQVRSDNGQSILNWQLPLKETMQAELVRAGNPLQMTDDQYALHGDDFKAHYEQQASDGKPLKTDNIRKSKFRNWLQNVAAGHPKGGSVETMARPYSNRSDSFNTDEQPTKTLSHEDQLAINVVEMQKAGLMS